MDKKLFFSVFSGVVYELPVDEIGTLDEAQVPLNAGPKLNCPKCYGRGFVDKDYLRNTYTMCKCLRKHIDWNAYNAMITEKHPELSLKKKQEEILAKGPVTYA